MSEVRDEATAPAAPTAPNKSSRLRPRQTRLLALLAALALLALTLGGKWLHDRRATHRAAVAAANGEVLQRVDERYESLGGAARAGLEAATQLGGTLQEHLIVSERSDAELTADRQLQAAALAAAGKRLRSVSTTPPPELPPLADERSLRPDLERFRDIQRRARTLGDQLVELAAASERWGAALTNLRAEAQRYVDVANADGNTHGDPAALRSQWERERAVLEAYRAAVLVAKEVPGLEAYGDAFLEYIKGSRAFIEEAITLLTQGQIEPYNQRLKEVFGVPDPFGLNAAVAAATGESLRSGVVVDVAEARDTTVELVDEVAAARRDLGAAPA